MVSWSAKSYAVSFVLSNKLTVILIVASKLIKRGSAPSCKSNHVVCSLIIIKNINVES